MPDPGAASTPLTVRKARMPDVPSLLALINAYAGEGAMLPRTAFEMSENIRDFTVICSGERVLGTAALHFYGSTVAEVRSLAVDREYKSHGLGRLLVEAVEQEAVDFGLELLFAFTYVPKFFEKLGFVVVDRGELPLKAWKDCLRCPKFQRCDEIAMRKVLREGADTASAQRKSEDLVTLPTLALR